MGRGKACFGFVLFLFALLLTDNLFAERPRRRLSSQESAVPVGVPGSAPTSAIPVRVDTSRAGLVGLATESNFWRADRAEYSVGYEATGTSNSALPQNAALIGMWLNRDFGFEAFFGYTDASDSAQQTSNTATNNVADSSVLTITNGGTSLPGTFILGGVLKYRLVQTSWFQFYAGFILAVSPSMGSSYGIGTRQETTPDTDDPSTRTVSEVGFGTVEVKRTMELSMGPKLGTEFYLRWFPHLGLGFSTGLLTSFGGNTVTTTTSATRNFDIVNNVEQDPTVTDSTTNISVETDRGTRGTTFGLGGTNFQFTGVFTIRYVW